MNGRPRWARRHDEAGMVFVWMAVFLVVALALAAFVIDLAALRQDRASNRSAADMAATAGARRLSEGHLTASARVDACNAAWTYATKNLGVTGSAPDCAAFGTTVCDNSTTVPMSKSGTAGNYTITITNPVTNLDTNTINNSGAAGAYSTTIDGKACERVAVSITQIRSFAFASIIGAHTGSTTSESVGRAISGTTAGELAALLILEPSKCEALTANGGGTIEVKGVGTSPGIIAVDSSATAGGGGPTACANNKWAVDATTNSNTAIMADAGSSGTAGKLELYALTVDPTNQHGYEGSQLTNGNLSPQPIASPSQYGRSVVDNQYNCDPATNVSCQASGPYDVNVLQTNYGSGTPAGFATITGAACNVTTGTVTYSGDTFVNCPTFSVKNATATFTGSVVFAGGVSVQTGGTLNVNPAATADRFVYLRTGDFSTSSSATLNMQRTFVFLKTGVVALQQTNPVNWTAPTGGAFHGLALWSESSSDDSFKGQASLSLDGVYFTPNAHVQFDGQGSQVQLHAQFIANTLDMSGSGTLVMTPDPNSTVRLPVVAASLIR
jgi:hypothetical protein